MKRDSVVWHFDGFPYYIKDLAGRGYAQNVRRARGAAFYRALAWQYEEMAG